MKNKSKKSNNNEKIINGILVAVIIFSVLSLGYSAKVMFFSGNNQATSQTTTTQMPIMGRMSFTSFDRALAKEFMDKNNDGKCDSCGMPVDMCIDSGQMQCNTDTKSTIGDLGTQHIHADWKVYINRQPVDFNGKDHMTRMRSNYSVSSFIHVDSGAPSPEKTGDLLHMHAKGVPLWIFFESIEMELPDSIIVYVNSKPEPQGLDYVFSDLDKILITDENGDLEQQLNSITDFAGIH